MYKFANIDELVDNQLINKVKSLIPQFVQVAQEEYNAWDENAEYFQDEYAGGGICHIIADKICDVLSQNEIACTTYSLSHKQHVISLAYDENAHIVLSIDLPEYIYETGGGFSWTKIPDVMFTKNDFIIDKLDWNDYFSEDGEFIEY